LKFRCSRATDRSYTAAGGPTGTVHNDGWGIVVQTARPRDVGALLFVIGLFLMLFVVTLLVPVR
jgi:hypothetical protein